MKRVLLILLLAVIASAAFAVDFSLTTHLSTGYIPYIESVQPNWSIWPDVDAETIPFVAFPSIGIAVGFDKIDILGEIDIGIFRQTENKGEIDEFKYRLWALGFNVGIAPKIQASDRFSLSFPILFKFVHVGNTFKIKDPSGDVKVKVGRNAIGIDFGTRATYSFNGKLSGFIGFQAPLFTVVTQYKYKYTEPGYSESGENKKPQFNFLNYGTIDLGIKFTF